MKQLLHTSLGIAVLALCVGVPAPASAQNEDAFDREPANCISTFRIRRTKVVDDETILFYMGGGAVYRNVLRQTCLRLARNDLFSYENRTSQLCRNDTITVLERGGFGLERGLSCALGTFQPITPDEAELIVNGSDIGSDSVEINPIELPPDAGTDAEPNGDAGSSSGAAEDEPPALPE